MPPRVSFTFDLEDHRSGLDPASRYVDATYRVLDFLDRVAVAGTFFIVGNVGERHPALVREIAARRHEVAFHGFDHTPLDEDEPANFVRQTTRGKRFFEDLIGRDVVGYRAPIFSLLASTTWSAETFASLGFTYSSSVLPAASPRKGFPGAPRHPFKWPNGVIELPAAITDVGGIALPFLGGVYFRYFPLSLMLRRVQDPAARGLWTYLHPYDCDPDEGWQRVERTNVIESLILACNRRHTLDKMERLLTGWGHAPLRDRVASGEFADAPTIAIGDLAASSSAPPTGSSRAHARGRFRPTES
jgi:peptidoglycan-N-acetylglucosamine deacetylase